MTDTMQTNDATDPVLDDTSNHDVGIVNDVNSTSLTIPDQDDPAAWQQLYQTLGCPEDANDYDLKLSENDEVSDWFRSEAHKYGLSQKQAGGLTASWSELVQTMSKNHDQLTHDRSNEAIISLKQQWGSEYDHHLSQAKQAAMHSGLDADQIDHLETAIGTESLLTLFSNLGAGMKEAEFVESASSDLTPSPVQAKEDIKSLTSDSEFMAKYLNGDQNAVSMMQNAMKRAYD